MIIKNSIMKKINQKLILKTQIDGAEKQRSEWSSGNENQERLKVFEWEAFQGNRKFLNC